MPDLLQNAAEWHDAMRRQFAASTVTYSRGAASLELAASQGQSEFEQSDGYGARVIVKSHDFLITAADLVLGGQKTEPKVGDKISETRGDKVFVYQVLPPEGEPPFRPSDPRGVTLRIHTKHIATEAA